MNTAAIRADMSIYSASTVEACEAEAVRCLALAMAAHTAGKAALASAWNHRAGKANHRRNELTARLAA